MVRCRHCERNGVERGNPIFFLLLVILFHFLSSCHRTSDPLIGCWTVEKVNVEFDENKATPEMVRQYGELERGNVIEIGQDSMLTLVSGGDTLRGKCLLKGAQAYRDDDVLFSDGNYVVRYEKGGLQSESITPLGRLEVTYRSGRRR